MRKKKLFKKLPDFFTWFSRLKPKKEKKKEG
jgi:hypothetical protein